MVLKPLTIKLAGMVLAVSLLSGPALPQDDGLGLTPEQAKAIHTIRSSYLTRRTDVQKQLKEKKVELLKLLRQSEVDRDAVKGKMGEIMDLELLRQHMFVDEMFDCRNKMSPDQWATFRHRIVKSMLSD